MTKFVKNEEFWQFSQSRDKRNTSSILPKWNKKQSTADINELGKTAAKKGDL